MAFVLQGVTGDLQEQRVVLQGEEDSLFSSRPTAAHLKTLQKVTEPSTPRNIAANIAEHARLHLASTPSTTCAEEEAIDAAWPPQEVVEHIESLKREDKKFEQADGQWLGMARKLDDERVASEWAFWEGKGCFGWLACLLPAFPRPGLRLGLELWAVLVEAAETGPPRSSHRACGVLNTMEFVMEAQGFASSAAFSCVLRPGSEEPGATADGVAFMLRCNSHRDCHQIAAEIWDNLGSSMVSVLKWNEDTGLIVSWVIRSERFRCCSARVAALAKKGGVYPGKTELSLSLAGPAESMPVQLLGQDRLGLATVVEALDETSPHSPGSPEEALALSAVVPSTPGSSSLQSSSGPGLSVAGKQPSDASAKRCALKAATAAGADKAAAEQIAEGVGCTVEDWLVDGAAQRAEEVGTAAAKVALACGAPAEQGSLVALAVEANARARQAASRQATATECGCFQAATSRAWLQRFFQSLR
ncbi:unnamed protein product [Symbiodinium natans]|uniref:Uncharacterized protein n=1 Tax=Symbiodinium natans TaxID=878477 RepID=A0A812UX76_9DINO|nr:unnamed protein product [Symbiodinium natans]